MIGRIVQCVCCSWLVLSLASCSGEKGRVIETVSGTVSFNGQPVQNGEIYFRPVAGDISGGGGRIENGTFSFRTPQAKMRVEILARREIPGKFEELNPGQRTPVLEQYIPKKYNEESELTAEVEKGKTEFNFQLLSE